MPYSHTNQKHDNTAPDSEFSADNSLSPESNSLAHYKSTEEFPTVQEDMLLGSEPVELAHPNVPSPDGSADFEEGNLLLVVFFISLPSAAYLQLEVPSVIY